MRKFECREEPCSTYHPWVTCNLITPSQLTSPRLLSPPLRHGFFFFLTFCHPSHSVVTFQPLELTSIVQIWAGGPESNRTSTCITSSYCMPRQCHNRHPCFSHFHIVYCICHAVGMMAWSKSQQDGSWNKSKFVSCLCKCLV